MKKYEDINTENIGANLSNINKAIYITMQKIEPNFLQLGQSLQIIYDDANTLSDISTATSKLIGDHSEVSILDNIKKIVKKSLTALDSCQGAIKSVLNNIASSDESMNRLEAICLKIKQCGKYLNIVGLNIGIESSRSKEAIELFEDFDQEIKNLANNIKNIALQIIDATQLSKKTQHESQESITERIVSLSNVSLSVKGVVKKQMIEIEKLTDISITALNKVKDHSKNIYNQVGEIVMSIQFHDIVRQKLEHTSSSFQDIIDIISDDSEQLSNDSNKNKKYKYIYSILNIQTAQIKNIIEELKDAYQNILTSFNNISNEIGWIIQNEAASDINQSDINNMENQYLNLKQGLETLNNLLNQGYELGKHMGRSVEASSKTITTLSNFADKVNDINFNLKMKAINAIIMTNKLGDMGMTLGVLAQEVSEISNESTSLVTKILSGLKTINQNSNIVNDQIYKEKIDCCFQVSLDSEIDNITGLLEKYKQDSHRAEKQAYLLQQKIEKTNNDLTFLAGLIQEMEGILKLVNNIQKIFEPWQHELEDETDAEISKSAARYTMESERKIHLKTIKQAPKARQITNPIDINAQNIHLTQNDDTDNIKLFTDENQDRTELFLNSDDNVELFDGNESYDDNIDNDTQQNDTLDDNIELFLDDDNESYDDNIDGNDTQQSDTLDDNVELFLDDDNESYDDNIDGNNTQQSDTFDDNVELFSDDDSDISLKQHNHAQKKDKDEEYLGDNIELF